MGAQGLRERRFAAALGAVVIAYAGWVVAMADIPVAAFIGFFAEYLMLSVRLWVFAGAAAIGFSYWSARRSGDIRSLAQMAVAYVQSARASGRGITLALPIPLFALLMAGFNAFKQQVLPHAGFGFDAVLARWDRALFFGIDPWRLTHTALPSPWATWAMDLAYHAWFAPMALGVMACAFLPARYDRLRLRYLTSYVLLWIVGGSAVALMMPAAGPCFQGAAFADVTGFAPLMQRLNGQDHWLAAQGFGLNIAALDYQAALAALIGREELAMGAGISAMPSIHNGLAVLFALAGFHLHRVLGWALCLYALLIWIGSVHLGWHYAVDGPVAAALVCGIWRLSGWLADLHFRVANPPASVTLSA